MRKRLEDTMKCPICHEVARFGPEVALGPIVDKEKLILPSQHFMSRDVLEGLCFSTLDREEMRDVDYLASDPVRWVQSRVWKLHEIEDYYWKEELVHDHAPESETSLLPNAATSLMTSRASMSESPVRLVKTYSAVAWPETLVSSNLTSRDARRPSELTIRMESVLARDNKSESRSPRIALPRERKRRRRRGLCLKAAASARRRRLSIATRTKTLRTMALPRS
ncbi:hypothetical protein BJ878DRAFT_201294 [Calycina marina]|uniref:Uncharacterized protein n=1 Tax=Calycina marina TaxID=1763456 RepID=A0A9P8CHV5_9HELO|nr:hypothetical protein BJ878DRAFT_201294 [Calycina marina]